MIRLRPSEFLDIVAYVREKYGINLEKKKVLIECRMKNELDRYGLPSFKAYMEALRKDKTGRIAGEMINRLTTNYTYFMREVRHFDYIREKILPEALTRGVETYQIWCAGCATGEECYTLAMLYEDFRRLYPGMPAADILATDICESALEQARRGVYPLKVFEALPRAWRQSYCKVLREDKCFEIRRSLKAGLQFKNQNLMDADSSRRKFDLILCRNVMIYFDAAAKRKVIRKLESRLKPGGYLIVGLTEVLPREIAPLEFVGASVYRKPE